MIYVVNYASDRYLESQALQNAAWAQQAAGEDQVRVCSFSREHLLPILQSLDLANEGEIRRVLEVPRGDGLWAWKAILSYHVYRNVADEGDLVFYMDSGAYPVSDFRSIWRHVRDRGYFFVRVSAFEQVPAVRAWLMNQPAMASKQPLLDDLNFSSRLWTKPLPSAPGNLHGLPHCVVARLAAAGRAPLDACDDLLDEEQVCGGFQGYLKNEGNDRILKDLLATTSLAFMDDVVRCAQARAYIDHRHDQSLLSLIVNAECIRNPGFSLCIANRLDQVRLHRAIGL